MNNETTAAVAKSEVTEEQIALCITQQYEDVCNSTQGLVKKTLCFGAMFAHAEIELEARGLIGNRKAGQGMADWLKKNCAGVNYKTAMRWKQIAVNAANSLSCSSDVALRLLQDETIDVPSKVIERRDNIFDQASVRKLTQQLFDFAREDRGTVGRPTGTMSKGPTEKLSRIDAARRLWAKPIAMFNASFQAFNSSAKLLPYDEARETLAVLKQLCGALKARIDEK